MAEKRVLAVGVGRKTLESVQETFDDGEFEVDLVPTARSGLTLAFEVRFDLLVVGHPLADLVIRNFLRGLRDKSSASRDAKVMILAEDTGDHELRGLRETALEIVPRSDALLGDLTSKALGGAPRTQLAMMVRLEVEFPYGTSIRICQSENLSATGMLVRSEDSAPVGTPVAANFTVPGSAEPIEATGRVVRETMPGEIPGIAVHFEGFAGDSEARLKSYLAQRQSS